MASRPCEDVHVTKSRNWKLIHVTSSNEYREQNGVDLSAYSRYLNQIWRRAQTPHCEHDEICQIQFT